tara:strand:+ start:88 stop:264 length:177 start_codon:yes stop_codon:yes gene_type:complete
MKIYKNKRFNKLRIRVLEIKKNVVYYEYLFGSVVCDIPPKWEMSVMKFNERYEVMNNE